MRIYLDTSVVIYLLDAVHCAAAVAARCDWLLTNDADLRAFAHSSVQTVILGDYI